MFFVYKADLNAIRFTALSLFSVFMYGLILLILIWLAWYSLTTFFRLHGHERIIEIDDRAISFPRLGDSLEIIRLEFAQIRDVYFGKGRHGHPENLLIEYDTDGHAYIQRESLDKHDFDRICEIVMHRLELDEIKLK